MSSEVIVVARIRAAKGKGDALVALLAEQAGAVRAAERGCLAYRLLRSTKDAELFTFYEVYKDAAAFDAHRAAAHLAAYRQRREGEGLVAGAVEVEVFRAVGE